MDLLMIIEENKSHCVYIKNFNRFMCNKTKNKNKMFTMFRSEKVLQEHKETCLKINGKQSVKLRSDSVKFKSYFKQLAAPFKIYADFESLKKEFKVMIEIKILHILKNIKNTFLAVLLIKLFVLMINLVNHLFFTEEKMQSINLLKQF